MLWNLGHPQNALRRLITLWLCRLICECWVHMQSCRKCFSLAHIIKLTTEYSCIGGKSEILVLIITRIPRQKTRFVMAKYRPFLACLPTVTLGWPRWLSWMHRPTGDQEVQVHPPQRSAAFFCGDWSWNIFYGHSLPSADSRRAVVNFLRKNVHNTG